MEKEVQRRVFKEIKRMASKRLVGTGFSGINKYYRKNGEWFEIIIIHKFSFGPVLRVHAALRHQYDTFDVIGLNGPHTDSVRGFDLSFTESDESIEDCVNEIVRFTKEVAEPWFKKMLLLSKEELCSILKVRLDEGRSEKAKVTTYKLLGYKLD